MQQLESVKEFGGWLKRYTHQSTSCSCEMIFSVYLPPLAEKEKVPVVYWLSGLTCTDDNFRTKAGAQRYASQLGIALIIPDTSPRGDKVPDAKDRYDLGKGAGFYVNATQQPWAKHYQMYNYITDELPALIENNFPVTTTRSIAGHSMGGHGALICALKNPGMYQAVSAFAPICQPTECGWGQGCFSAYLGDDTEVWKQYDACRLISQGATKLPILVDQGLGDEFLADQLHPDKLQSVCKTQGWPLSLRRHADYDHSYHFISTFIGDHLSWHEKHLRG